MASKTRASFVRTIRKQSKQSAKESSKLLKTKCKVIETNNYNRETVYETAAAAVRSVRVVWNHTHTLTTRNKQNATERASSSVKNEVQKRMRKQEEFESAKQYRQERTK